MVAPVTAGCEPTAPGNADRLVVLRGLGDGRFADPRVIDYEPLEPESDPGVVTTTSPDQASAVTDIVIGDFEVLSWAGLDLDGDGHGDIALHTRTTDAAEFDGGIPSDGSTVTTSW
jgi:hypothetical protein